MDSLAEIQKTLEPELNRMNEIIRQSLETDNELMNRVVTNYLLSKGKQIRPIMVLLSAKFFKDVNEDVLHAGAALEMLHNASLIHDDVVDETSLRRGRTTINTQWGNHLAVLVGDFFVANALSASIATGNISVISSLSHLGKELSLGEVDQICNVREHRFDEPHYMGMIRKKTASLFMNCVKMGAESVGVKEEEYVPLMKYAEIMGLCFQIRDDIFDYFEDSKIGKPTGNDLKEGKVTLPLLYALNNTESHKAKEIKESLIKGLPDDNEILMIVNFAKENGGVEYAFSKMRTLQQEAEVYLNEYPDSKWKEAFRNLFDYIISRDR